MHQPRSTRDHDVTFQICSLNNMYLYEKTSYFDGKKCTVFSNFLKNLLSQLSCKVFCIFAFEYLQLDTFVFLFSLNFGYLQFDQFIFVFSLKFCRLIHFRFVYLPTSSYCSPASRGRNCSNPVHNTYHVKHNIKHKMKHSIT